MEVTLRRLFVLVAGLSICTILYLGQCSNFDNFQSCIGFAVHKRSNSNGLKAHRTASLSSSGKERRMPDAVIIGAKKAGTRALLRFLRLHPNVSACGPEVHFFDRHYKNGLDWYRNQMPLSESHQIVMEKTPKYLVTKGAPLKLYKINKNVKVLIILRDPVRRALSDFTQGHVKRTAANSTKQSKSFKKEVLLKDGKTVRKSSELISVGMYAHHLKKWYRLFPRDQILIVNGESLVKSPAKEMKRVQHFLGLSIYVDEGSFVYSKDKHFYCLYDKRNLKPSCLSADKGRMHVKTEPFVLRTLYDFYEPFNRELYNLTGIDFGWKQEIDV